MKKKTSCGNSALHIACLNGQDAIIDVLVSNGASVDACNLRNQVVDDDISCFASYGSPSTFLKNHRSELYMVERIIR